MWDGNAVLQTRAASGFPLYNCAEKRFPVAQCSRSIEQVDELNQDCLLCGTTQSQADALLGHQVHECHVVFRA
jgi:hypothetical protein